MRHAGWEGSFRWCFSRAPRGPQTPHGVCLVAPLRPALPLAGTAEVQAPHLPQAGGGPRRDGSTHEQACLLPRKGRGSARAGAVAWEHGHRGRVLRVCTPRVAATAIFQVAGPSGLEVEAAAQWSWGLQAALSRFS